MVIKQIFQGCQQERTEAGAAVSSNTGGVTINSSFDKREFIVTLSGGATVAHILSQLFINWDGSGAIDFTLRVGLPAMELASGATLPDIKTSGSAVTVETIKAVGILIEESRENEILQSDALGTTWTNPGANTTITNNAGLFIDGNTTMEDILHDDNAETIQQTLTATDNTVYTISAVVAQGTTGSHDFIKIAWLDESDGANGFEAWFDLIRGVVGTGQADGTGTFVSHGIINLGNGRFRIFATGQIVSGQTDARFEIINTTADAVDTAETTNSVFWGGMSAEIGASLTSYSATTTGTSTRAAVVATKPISEILGFVTTEGSGLIEHTNGAGVANNASVLSINDDSTSDRLLIFFSSNEAQYLVSSGGGTSAQISDLGGLYVANTTMKQSFAWKVNDFSAARDATLGTPDIAGAVPVGLATVDLGARHNRANVINGHIGLLELFNSRLPDTILEDKTAFVDFWFEPIIQQAANDNDYFPEFKLAVNQ